MRQGGRKVVLGAGYAGVLASIRLARQGMGVTLVDASESFCERIRLHQLGAGQVRQVHSIEALLQGSGVQFERRCIARIDVAGRRLEATDGTALGFDELILATGSVSDRERVPGAAEHALAMADSRDAQRLSEAVEALARSRARVLVVGGGLTGIETATELAESHPSLQLILSSDVDPAAAFSRGAARHLRKRFSDWRIDVVHGERVTEVAQAEARLAGGGRIQFDACIWAGSFRPGRLAREAGLRVDSVGRAVLDDRLRSRSHPFVSVAGDAGLVLKSPERASAMSCQLAMPMGAYIADRIAAERCAGNTAPFRFRAALRCVSLGRSDAIVQPLRADESAAPAALTGRLAARIKDSICQMTLRAFEGERRGSVYRWMSGTIANETAAGPAEEESHAPVVRPVRS
jgi:NADH dehydrogenase